MTHILAIDQGTTSTRAILFDAGLQVIATAQEEFPQHYPASGWVEHDPEAIWESVTWSIGEALKKAGIKAPEDNRLEGDREALLEELRAERTAATRPASSPHHGGPQVRVSSPAPGRSTLSTSAP